MPTIESVAAHFRTHSAAGLRDGRCLWPGCVSTPKAGYSLVSETDIAETRFQDMGQHVLDSHCDLRWICAQCLRSDFESKRSMKRHLRDTCKSRSTDVAVICAHCGSRWRNQADMARHASHCVCTDRNI
jgi:hypothetical protein